MTANMQAPEAKRPRKTTSRKTTTKAETPATGKAPSAEKRAPRSTRKTVHAVTVRKVALGVNDLPKALYDDALERVGGDPRKLYRVKVTSRNSYELLLPGRPEPV